MLFVRPLVALGTALAMAHALGAPPSHCRHDEHRVLTAWMGPVYATEGGWRNTQQGKLLSLCADAPQEPFSQLVYRYGKPGRVEFEAVASATSPFRLDSRSTSPHTGHDLVFFRRGPYTYYVAIATAQGRGVSLFVFRGQAPLARHFSGNEAGSDFELGPAELNFDALPARSPVLVRADAEHDF